MFFHFLFFIFPKKKVSSFLFSCISFKYVLLLALVSEFNSFLRSRCSIQMWCPDDIGRDSWDWVGPPAWVRACFNSPEWDGGSSPVKKTEPPQIVLLLLSLSLSLSLWLSLSLSLWLWLWLWLWLCSCCVLVVFLLCSCCVVVVLLLCCWCVVGVLLVCCWCVVGVCVWWLYYPQRTIIVRWADFSDFSLIFVGKMCVFVSRPIKIATFLRKNDYSPKRVVDFPRERDTFRNKIMEIVKDFDEKITTTTVNPGNPRGFCV